MSLREDSSKPLVRIWNDILDLLPSHFRLKSKHDNDCAIRAICISPDILGCIRWRPFRIFTRTCMRGATGVFPTSLRTRRGLHFLAFSY